LLVVVSFLKSSFRILNQIFIKKSTILTLNLGF